MNVIRATVVSTTDLLDTVLYAVVSGIGLALVFSLAIWGAIRFAEFSRDQRHLAAGGAAALSLLALAATLGAVVFGIILMAQK
jgi:hypothetical protein